MDTGKEDNDKRDLIDITKYAKPQDDTPLGEWKEVKRRKQKRINNNQKEKQESIKERIQHEQAAPVTQNSFDELLEEFEIQDKATQKEMPPEDYNKGDGNKEQGGKEEDEWADTNSSEDDISEESTNKGKVENNTPGVSNKSEQAEEQTENNIKDQGLKKKQGIRNGNIRALPITRGQKSNSQKPLISGINDQCS
ncbi:hypothetical protein HAX54_019387 [Datura stramonium]|uniref:Uncharacterized protein n=1 Tax=Datura stramonium TaxID=4076 RepID=A0ABS8UR46_DATST|nr:hypothetical protein [Datura stramonium]